MSFFVITCTFNPYFVRKILFGGDGSVGFAQSHGHYMDWLPPNMVISKPILMAETKLQHSSLQSTLASIVTCYGLLHWCISCSLWPLHLCSALQS